MNHSKKVILTGGGTGGHVFPALAIADALRKKGCDVLYVGSPTGMETKLVPPAGFRLVTLKSGAVKNQGLLKTATSLIRVFLSIFEAISLLRKEKPVAVVGVGGYVSVPVSIAAFLLRVPLFLQEQNCSVGIANRFLGKLARKIFLGFSQAEKYFDSTKCLVTGNPLRSVFYDQPMKPVSAERIHVLVMGGSQGARAINQAIATLGPKLAEKFPNLTLTHQTGERDLASVTEAHAKSLGERAKVFPFLNDVRTEYEKASLVICRAGALTVSELMWVQRPAIFVPFPRKGQNDQVDNAKFLEKVGAARVVEQGDNFEKRMDDTLFSCLTTSNLNRMSQSYSALPRSNALGSILDSLFQELGTNP